MSAHRAVASLITAAALVHLPAAAAESAAGAEPVPAPQDVVCQEVVPEATTATTTAQACGDDVEVLEARTPWDTLYAQPDGMMRWETSATALRTQVDGAWTEVDPSVVSGQDGLVVAAPVTAMTFSDGTDGVPLARLVRDDHELTFDVPVDLPVPAVQGDRITYADVLPGVDLLVAVNDDATGFSEVLRVQTPEAAENPRLAELTFPVTVDPDLELDAVDGGFVVSDLTGDVVFTSPVPTIWDSSVAPVAAGATLRRDSTRPSVAARDVGAGGEEAADPVDGPRDGAAVAMMPAEVSADGVTIVPDAALIASPETVWPVYIDPSVSGTRNQWTAIRDVYGQKWAFDPDEGLGLCSRATSTTCSTTFKSRLLWNFSGLGTIGALTSSQITSATFSAVGTHSYDCTARPVTLYRVSDFTSATAWPGGSSWIPQSSQTFAAKDSCAGQPSRRIEFDATEMARAVADAGNSAASFGLASDESSMVNWKRFRNDATFSVTYNRPPNKPTNVQITAGSTTTACSSTPVLVNTTTPTARAVVADPDGGNVQADFNIWRNGAVVHDGPLTAAKASGSEHTLTAPAGKLVNGATYEWGVTGRDPGGLYGPVATCLMTVDTTAPAAPSVTAVTGTAYPTLYPRDSWAGGIGKTGGFRFADTSTDVARYGYSFNNTAITNWVSGSTPTVTFTPTALGLQTLRVQAVDLAGNTSAVTTYQLFVTFPSAAGLWLLDEGTGTTSVDSGPAGNKNPLKLIGTPTWTDGPLGPDEGDRALQLDADVDTAATTGPVIATRQSFTVAATVRLDSVPADAATAVSQDGAVTSGFQLGYRTVGCPDPTAGCWAFGMSVTDTAVAPVLATSTVPVSAGSWVYLAGVHNAETDTVRLYVCPLDELTLTPSAPASFTAAWDAVGAFRIGQARVNGAAKATFPGAVADVQVLDGVAGEQQLLRGCNRTFEGTVQSS